MSVQQLDLDYTANAIPPYQAGSATSMAAALAHAPRTGTQRARVLNYIREHGASGVTREEISDGLNMRLSSVCGRVAELLDRKAPLIAVAGTRRALSGMPAEVLVLAGGNDE